MFRVGIDLKHVEKDIAIDEKLVKLLKRLNLRLILRFAMRNDIDAVDFSGLVGQQSDQLLQMSIIVIEDSFCDDFEIHSECNLLHLLA